MRLRKLQRKDENEAWYDDAYALEDKEGRVIFRYNLTWGRVGAACQKEIRDQEVTLEQLEGVIPPGDSLRWLEIEEIETEEAERYLTALNKACDIPKPRSVATALAA